MLAHLTIVDYLCNSCGLRLSLSASVTDHTNEATTDAVLAGFEHLATVWPVARPENETRSDGILKHIGAPLFSTLVRTDTMMKRRPLPSAVRSAQTLCKNRFPILRPIIYVGVESPGPREEMQMIWQNNVGADFPIGGFSPDRPQELMVFVRR